MRLPLALCCTSLALAVGVHAQTFTTGPCPPAEQRNADGNWYSGHHSSACEARSANLPLPARLDVRGSNGGIKVVGEDRSDVALEAIVVAQADTTDQAQALLREITLTTTPAIEAHGPQTSHDNSPRWHVEFHLRVPHQLAAHLSTLNGGITLAALDGTVDAQTTNGPLDLRDLAGNITALTTNGPIDITLSGGKWSGTGLSATTTNGPIALVAAPNFSAHLIAATTHGGIDAGNLAPAAGTVRTHLDTDLGHGGAPLRLQTTNGGISLSTR